MLQSKQADGKSRLVPTLINAGWHVNAPPSASTDDATEIPRKRIYAQVRAERRR